MNVSKTILVFSPDNDVAWSARKRFLSSAASPRRVRDELSFLTLLSTLHPKSAGMWAHRDWIWNCIVLTIEWPQKKSVEDLLREEILVCANASRRYRRNYYAWTHRLRMNIIAERILGSDAVHFLRADFDSLNTFTCKHVSDYSAWNHRLQLLLRGRQYDGFTTFENERSFVGSLMRDYPGHPSMWLHRRNLFMFEVDNREGVSVDMIEREIRFCRERREGAEALTKDEPLRLSLELKHASSYLSWLLGVQRDKREKASRKL